MTQEQTKPPHRPAASDGHVYIGNCFERTMNNCNHSGSFEQVYLRHSRKACTTLYFVLRWLRVCYESMGFKVGGASEMLFARTVKAPFALNRTRKASWSKVAACLLFPSLCSNALQLSQDCLEYGIETGIVIVNNGPCKQNRLINAQHMKQNSQKLMSLSLQKASYQ